jgi:hypothetical protein
VYAIHPFTGRPRQCRNRVGFDVPCDSAAAVTRDDQWGGEARATLHNRARVTLDCNVELALRYSGKVVGSAHLAPGARKTVGGILSGRDGSPIGEVICEGSLSDVIEGDTGDLSSYRFGHKYAGSVWAYVH